VLAVGLLAACGTTGGQAAAQTSAVRPTTTTPGGTASSAPAPAPTAAAGTGSGVPSAPATRPPATAPARSTRTPAAPPAPGPDARLAAALDPLRAATSGHLSLAVTDLDDGTSADYAPDGHAFVTASIAKVDILAALLLRAQDEGRALDDDERAQAEKMIEASDNDAANALWTRIGQGPGLAAANRRFGLTRTVPGAGGLWGLTTTTAADQVRLLSRLTSASSPLTAASRSYLLGLMGKVEDDQAWGVPAAAAPGTTSAVKNGWLPRSDTGLWVVNSVGVVRSQDSGHRLLVAVLSDDQTTERAGIDLVESAAVAAVKALR
jgi:beta-lactamase class A